MAGMLILLDGRLMKRTRVRIFGYGDEPCEKLYFDRLELVERVDSSTDLEGLTQLADIIELYMAYKELKGNDIDKIIIDDEQ